MTDTLEDVRHFKRSIIKWHIPVHFLVYLKFLTLQIAFFIHDTICESCIKVTILVCVGAKSYSQQIEMSNMSVSIVLSKYSKRFFGSWYISIDKCYMKWYVSQKSCGWYVLEWIRCEFTPVKSQHKLPRGRTFCPTEVEGVLSHTHVTLTFAKWKKSICVFD